MKKERTTFRLAVYTLLLNKNKVLLMRRYKTGWKDGWYTMPAGHVEANESLSKATIRETKEETGITINRKDLEYFHTMYIKSDINIIFTYFVAKKWKGDAKLMEEDKCDDMEWFDIKRLPKKTLGSVKQAIDAYFKKIPYSEYTFK